MELKSENLKIKIKKQSCKNYVEFEVKSNQTEYTVWLEQ